MRPSPDSHLCARCSTRLARDNSGLYCSACTSLVAADRTCPPVVQASFWDNSAILEAVDARHMGRLIAAYRHHPDHGTAITQAAMAEWAHLTQAQISRLERQPPDRQLDRLTFWAQLLKIPKSLLWFVPSTVARPAAHKMRVAAELDRRYVEAVPTSGTSSAEEDDDMRRRTILARLVAVVASPAGARVLANTSDRADLGRTERRVAKVREAYQQSQYERALQELPSVLTDLAAMSREQPHDARVAALTAEAYQVASGLLLKSDDPILAAVAAERSIVAARVGGNPLTVASSMRAVVHGLFAGGHPQQAASIAAESAAQLTRDVDMRSGAEFSVYGALLLRGAVAAARAEDRDQTATLLNEAAAAAHHVGHGDNVYWTAFNPTNVLAHRVSVAVELGDAGTAVQLAQTIDLSLMAVPERRAVLTLDTARALTQWGRYERAFDAIRRAEQHAPEEVRGRRSVHQLINELGSRCSGPLQRRVFDYASAIGVTA